MRDGQVMETNLDISLSFVGDLHQELCLAFNHVLEDAFVDTEEYE
jgi:hypothetical protein